MQGEKGLKTLAIAAILVAAISLSIAYAAFSATLNINGTAVVKGNQWSVHYDTASKTATIPTGSQATNVTDNFSLTATDFTFTVNLVKPGDTITYTVDVVNTGAIDAKLDSITGLTVSGAAANYIDVTLTGVQANDTLAATTGKATVTITVTYKTTIVDMPKEDLTATITGALNYVQA